MAAGSCCSAGQGARLTRSPCAPPGAGQDWAAGRWWTERAEKGEARHGGRREAATASGPYQRGSDHGGRQEANSDREPERGQKGIGDFFPFIFLRSEVCLASNWTGPARHRPLALFLSSFFSSDFCIRLF